MPYIASKTRREQLIINPWGANDAGELNFVLTQIILDYLPGDAHYEDYNTIIGVLEACKLEFHRRAMASYEDTKILLNGDCGYDELPQNRST